MWYLFHIIETKFKYFVESTIFCGVLLVSEVIVKGREDKKEIKMIIGSYCLLFSQSLKKEWCELEE